MARFVCTGLCRGCRCGTPSVAPVASARGRRSSRILPLNHNHNHPADAPCHGGFSFSNTHSRKLQHEFSTVNVVRFCGCTVVICMHQLHSSVPRIASPCRPTFATASSTLRGICEKPRQGYNKACILRMLATWHLCPYFARTSTKCLSVQVGCEYAWSTDATGSRPIRHFCFEPLLQFD